MDTSSVRRRFLSKLLTALLACVVPCATSNADAQDAPAADGSLAEVERLDTFNDDGLAKLADQIDNRRNAVLASLLDQLTSTKSSHDVKLYAAVCLGELRLSGASDALVENITLRHTHNGQPISNEATPVISEYPASTSLMLIGSDCFRSVVDGLATRDDREGRSMLLEVLGYVMVYPECARAVISHAISSETDAARVGRLHLALASSK